MSSKTALIIVAAEGSEEMEVIITGDVLTRGGLKVTYAGLTGTEPVTCARGARLVPDVSLSSVKNQQFDVIVIPGGPGCTTLASSELVGEILRAQHQTGRLIAAICAGPTVLMAHGIRAELVTSHPSVIDKLKNGGYNYVEQNVVVSGHVITSRGPGTTFEFALKIVEILEGIEKSQSLINPMVLKL